MAIGPHPEVEEAIAARHAAGDLAGAAALGYETYGPEILAFLEHELRDPDLALDAFSQLGVDLWRGLPGFRFEASFRTWAYRLARHAMYRLRRDPWARRALPALTGELSRIEARARSHTAPWRRTEVHDALAAIRDELDPTDRALLTLRLDRQMAWRDIALVMLEADEPASPAALKRRAAALRQRFQRVKALLRTRFEAAGLMGSAP